MYNIVMDISPFYIFLFIHLASLVVGFGAVVVTDTYGLLWMLGKKKMTEITAIADVTEKLIWIGWTGLVLSGSCLLYMKGYIDNLTWIKLFFVAMLGVNGIFLYRINKALKVIGDNPMPKQLFFRIGLASTISQIGWWGAVLIGFVHRHIESYIDWPPQPALFIIIFAAVILLVGFCGDMIYKKKSVTNVTA
jgi:hypothetical protein